MRMNFYQLYNLINEYGQSLIQTLIEKFQKEVPTLTPEQMEMILYKIKENTKGKRAGQDSFIKTIDNIFGLFVRTQFKSQ
jgi:hypothetical protein